MDTTTTRADHIAWCKERALEYLDNGETKQALTSMISDVKKHPETEDHVGLKLVMPVLMSNDAGDARNWIEGFS